MRSSTSRGTYNIGMQFRKSILKQLQEMSCRLRTITVASFVSGLRKTLVKRLASIHPDRNIASEHVSSELLSLGLLQERYDYVITEYKIEEPGVVCVPYIKDRLMVRVHKSDTLAARAKVTFDDLSDGKLLVWIKSGFWANYIQTQFGEKVHLVFINDEKEYLNLLDAFSMRSFAPVTTMDECPASTDYRYITLEEEGTDVPFYLCCLQKNSRYIPLLLPEKKDG